MAYPSDKTIRSIEEQCNSEANRVCANVCQYGVAGIGAPDACEDCLDRAFSDCVDRLWPEGGNGSKKPSPKKPDQKPTTPSGGALSLPSWSIWVAVGVVILILLMAAVRR